MDVVWIANFGAGLPKNWVLNVTAKFGESTQPYDTHNNSDDANVIGINSANVMDYSLFTIDASVFANLGAADFVNVKLTRDADHASDTYLVDIYIAGILIEHIADM